MPRKYTNKELLSYLRELNEEVDGSVTLYEMNDLGKVSASLYIKRFGSWNAAKEKANIPTRDPSIAKNAGRGKIPESELLNELNRLKEKIERVPGIRDMEDGGEFSAKTYCKRFGSWNDALRAAGMEPNLELELDRDILINKIVELADKLGRPPKYHELNELTKFSRKRYEDEFGSWNNAIKKAGFDPHHVRIRKKGKYPPGGSNFKRIREKVIQKDGEECRKCGITREKHKSIYNSDIHVHHIISRKFFLDNKFHRLEDGNISSNLITLCSSCHTKTDNRMKSGIGVEKSVMIKTEV